MRTHKQIKQIKETQMKTQIKNLG